MITIPGQSSIFKVFILQRTNELYGEIRPSGLAYELARVIGGGGGGWMKHKISCILIVVPQVSSDISTLIS